MKLRNLVCTFALLFLCGFAHAQEFETGMQTYSPYDVDGFQSVNLSNGNLIVNIPLISYPQLGQLPDLTLSVNYQNFGWTNNWDCDDEGSCWNWWTWNGPVYGDWGADGAFIDWSSADIVSQSSADTYDNPCFPYMVVVDQTGSVHPMGYTGPKTSSPFLLAAIDGSGFGMQIPATGSPCGISGPYGTPGTITSKRGIKSFVSPTTHLTNYQDPAGNTIINTGTGYTDSLERSIPLPPLSGSGCPTLNYPGLSGGTVPITYCYSTESISSASFDGGTGRFAGSWQALTSVTLPNGQTWTFTYSITGNLASITLPTGGSISYTWQDPVSACYGLCNTVLQYRDINANDGSSAKRWKYQYSGVNTTVTDPDGNDAVHTTQFLDVYHSTYFEVPYETLAQYYRGSAASGTLLKTVATTYTNIFGNDTSPGSYLVFAPHDLYVPMTVTTTLNDTGQVSETCFYYDAQIQQTGYSSGSCHSVAFDTSKSWYDLMYSGTCCNYPITYGSAVERDDYDFGSGAPGSLLRTTKTAYQWQASGSYLAAGLMDRPYTVTTYDGSGTTVAQTTDAYDSGSSCICGNVTSVTNWLSGGTSPVTQYAYNSSGMRSQMTDPNGNATNYHYDSSGAFLSEIDYPVTTGSTTHVEYFNYDDNTGLLLGHGGQNSSTATCGSGVQATCYTYDNMRRLTGISYPDGGEDTYTYTDTPSANCAGPYFTFAKTINSSTTFTETGIVDGLGRQCLTEVTSDPSGTDYVSTTYNGEGRVYSVSNPHRSSGNPTDGTTYYYYDALGRTCLTVPQDSTNITGPSCPSSQPTDDVFTTYTGNCSTVTDEAGIQGKSCMDALGLMTDVYENPSGLNYHTSYGYDGNGNLTSVLQSSSRSRTFAYDTLSRLLCAANPEVYGSAAASCPSSPASPPATTTGAINYGYDANGNLTSRTTPKENQTTSSTTVVTTYSYDALNRLLQKSYNDSITPTANYYYDGNTPSACSVSFSYGSYPKPLRTGMCDIAGSEAWLPDIMGRPMTDQRTTNGVTETTTYATTSAPYNYDGSVAKLSYLSGRSIAYGINAAGQGTSAVDSANSITYATSAGYGPTGELTSLTNGASSQILSAMYYNQRLQPCRVAVNPTGTTLPTTCGDATDHGTIMDMAYSFNLSSSDNGSVATVSDGRSGMSGRSVSYFYDALNRISSAYTNATTGSYCWGEAYTIDQWSNFTAIGDVTSPSHTGTGCTREGLSIGVSNQNQINSSGYGYDAAGNLTSAPPTGTAYQYDAEGRLCAVVSGTPSNCATGTTYVYDGDGRRVEKGSSGSPYKLYWYDTNGNVLDETDQSGSTTNSSFFEYVFFNGQRIARRDSSGNILYYFTDHLGTSRDIVQAGQTAYCYDADFYPFGGERAYTATCSQNYRFTGKERDSESGNDNSGARYYNVTSALGRFMSPDWSAAPAAVPYADLTHPQTLNLYAYVANNPTSSADPDGHSGCQVAVWGGGCGDIVNGDIGGLGDLDPAASSGPSRLWSNNEASVPCPDGECMRAGDGGWQQFHAYTTGAGYYSVYGPGSPYFSANAAGVAAGSYFLTASVASHQEYGGGISRDAVGIFTYDLAAIGAPCTPDENCYAPVPPNDSYLATWHTHPYEGTVTQFLGDRIGPNTVPTYATTAMGSGMGTFLVGPWGGLIVGPVSGAAGTEGLNFPQIARICQLSGAPMSGVSGC